MKVGEARAFAAEWVIQHASHDHWFIGAYFSGSTVGLPDDLELAISSDIDVVIVIAQEEPPLKLGKFIYRGTLVEVTYLSWNQLSSVEDVLSNYHLAGGFRTDTIIADPTGNLRRLQTQVFSHFAEMKWVRRRCEHARSRIEQGLRSINRSASWHDQVTAWLFPTGVTTHVLLAAALRNPTVRLRYFAAREVLLDYGHDLDGLYLNLLKLLGCAHLTPQQVEHHVAELACTFDAAAAVAKTPFFFRTDITSAARPIAIDGSLQLIRTGYHREAMFWIVTTFARCHQILEVDASLQTQRERSHAFEAVIADLGITSTESLISRAEDVIQFLPQLWNTVEMILVTNPAITGK
ncbi:hypothetical protein BVG16_21460 [Paenibacillus selenitireducens]|uniref:Polymerase nucleotidyl transferase domain-containing protein n=1 Tax=Paenibacillus selenitireducens TaxID=1324314 RepID=A0A1T2X5U2_9BACL|nr:hypothetical protein [Paenibacillus selenitireducens]OPA75175.1 hypothetical protein BVG16_21460 [Paenibacillus selenitireducens]